jgi:hypothetical protein
MGHTRQLVTAALQQTCLQLISAALVLMYAVQPVAAVDCTTNASFTPLSCLDALSAVQALVGNTTSSGINISNIVFTGSCDGQDSQLGLITDFGSCHYLGSTAGYSGGGMIVAVICALPAVQFPSMAAAAATCRDSSSIKHQHSSCQAWQRFDVHNRITVPISALRISPVKGHVVSSRRVPVGANMKLTTTLCC